VSNEMLLFYRIYYGELKSKRSRAIRCFKTPSRTWMVPSGHTRKP
jgi:hypothetical protein